MKRQMPDGSVTGVLGGAEAAKGMAVFLYVRGARAPTGMGIGTNAKIRLEDQFKPSGFARGSFIATPSSQPGGRGRGKVVRNQ